MSVSEKNRSKKNQYILATITAGLALGHISTESNNAGYSSPMATFVSAESCEYPVGYKLEDGFMEAAPGSSS